MNVVPYPVATAAARGLARFAFSVLGFKRQRTLSRIRGVFPEKSEREIHEIAVHSLQNVFETAIELMRVNRLDRKWMDKYVVEGQKYEDILKKLQLEGKGVVAMIPHCGNWYLAAWAMASYGLPLCCIGSRQRNPKIDAWMKNHYGNVEFFDRDDRSTLVKVKRALQGGRVFAIMPDLRVRIKDVEVDFLRGKANVSHAGAMFATKTGAPIVVAGLRRENKKHLIELLGVLRVENRTPEDLTVEIMKMMDDYVQKHPGDWYWFNKRWIQDPV